MLDEALINTSLETLEYGRVQSWTYKARWSTAAVEHFLFLEPFGKNSEFLGGSYGLRNPAAEEFSYLCMKRYAGRWADVLRYDAISDCSTRLDLSAINDPWKLWEISVRKTSPEKCAELIVEQVRDKLIPLIHGITTLRLLYDTLASDDERIKWSLTPNGAMRAAQVVALGHELGIERASILATLEPRLKLIDVVIRSGRPQSYLKAIFADWQDGRRQLPPNQC